MSFRHIIILEGNTCSGEPGSLESNKEREFKWQK